MKKAILASPVYLLVSVLYWLVSWQCGQPMMWAAFGFGALGWWIAYLLRAPISIVLMKMNKENQPKGLVFFSGPLEETVRLIVLLVLGTTARQALSIGQGWAFIEVLFAIVQLLALSNLKDKTDEKSMQAKMMLSENGFKLDGSPLWGALERVFASAFHIGSTLLIATNPWLVLVMIPLHTTFNFFITRLMRKSIFQMLLVVFVFGSVVFSAGLLRTFGF